MKTTKKKTTDRKQKPGAGAKKADGESAVLANLATMPGPDRALGERLHAIIKASAPSLSPRLWYGMPAYAKDGKIVCFFQSAQRFKTRYATFGFMHQANLDEGAMWPTAFGKDRRAREESGELRTELATGPRIGSRSSSRKGYSDLAGIMAVLRPNRRSRDPLP